MKNKLLLLLPLMLLASCGSSIDKLVPFGVDHSGTWKDNYYTYFDASLKEKEVVSTLLSRENNKVFTSYNDPNFKALEPRQNQYSYEEDYSEERGYGPNFKLSKTNNEMKDGFASKLYDGQFFCHGLYEKARVQINEEGFSASFYHELESASYLYLNFKSAIDFKSYSSVMEHQDELTVHITFYSDKAYKYSFSLIDVPTNYSDDYVFYGFSLKGLHIQGATHYSISYTLDYDVIKEHNPEVMHALLLYEFGLVDAKFKA